MGEQAESMILAQILDGTLVAGAQLPPIRDFSAQLGISFRTVQQALARLQQKGYVSMRQGAGTFVESAKPGLTLNDAVVVCMETQSHVYGELASLLTNQLHVRGRMPSMVNPHQANWREVLMQAARSDVDTFVVHGGPHFDFQVLRHPVFAGKQLIGVLDWYDSALAERIPLALADHRLGGELVARHLAAAGHRRVLVIGTSTPLEAPGRQHAGFLAAWRGRLDEVAVSYQKDETPVLDVGAVVSLFKGADAPTAVFGMRDFDVITLQRVLAREGCDLASICELVGYGNTPWSHGGALGFSSVDWNLEAMAGHICDFIVGRGAKEPAPCRIDVAPRLILRSR